MKRNAQSDGGSLIPRNEPLPALRNGVGILIHNAINRRLVESASMQLELDPVYLDEELLKPDIFAELELIVADDALAAKVRALLSAREERGEGVNPAVIAAIPHISNELHNLI